MHGYHAALNELTSDVARRNFTLGLGSLRLKQGDVLVAGLWIL
jgi:hypothetical protein